MTEFRNPKIPEGINVSKDHPLREFSILTLGISTVLAFFIVAAVYAVEWMVPLIPFSFEQKIARQLEKELTMAQSDFSTEAGSCEQTTLYLQGLMDRITGIQEFDTGMEITLHYLGSDTVNAFATLGGHVMVYKGLLEKIPHENALMTVLAHEAGHIKKRDPLAALGRGVVLSVLYSAVFGVEGSGAVADVMAEAGLLTMLSFSRDQEREADRLALETLKKYYGHTHGASALFKIFEESENSTPEFEFTRSHPLTRQRMEDAGRAAKSGILQPVQPLPSFFLNEPGC